jgi:hypothetical protein
MLKRVLLPALLISLCGAAATAHAQSGAYGQIGGSVTKLNDEDFGAINVGIGYNFTPMFAVEAEGSFGVSDKDVEVAGTKFSAKVDYLVGAYGVVYFPVSGQIDLIGRAGYMSGQSNLPVAERETKQELSGPAIGVGMRYFPGGGKNGVRVDATHYEFEDDVKGEIYQIAYVRKF